MSARDNSAIEAIKSRVRISDLVRRYVELRPMGSRQVAPCPFHQETKPSFSVNDEQGTFYCFGCQASGDIFDFYGRINGLDFKDSLEQLAEEAGVQLDRYRAGSSAGASEQRSQKQDILRLYKLAAAHYAANLRSAKGEDCRNYLSGRGISQETIDSFDLGWSLNDWQDLRETLRRASGSESAALAGGLLARSDSGRVYDRFRQRLIFPIKNLTGQVLAFGGRVLPHLAGDDDAKYINSSDSPIYKKGEHLYGLYQARKSISVKKNIILTEGYMDVITLHQFGYTQAVGVLGTAFTPDQVRRICGLSSQVELVFDGDNAGRKAALKASEMLLAKGLSVKVIILPDGEDIDSLLQTQGTEAFESLRRSAPDALVFCTDCLRKGSPREAVEWARAFLAQVEMPELFARYASGLGRALNLEEAELRGITADKQKRQADSYAPSQSQLSVSNDKEIIRFAVRYPQRLEDLRACGADLLLSASWALKFWDKLDSFSSTEVFQQLNENEKRFWIQCRDGLTEDKNQEEQELQLIVDCVHRHRTSTQQDALAAALRTGPADYNTQKQYLTAMMAARGRQSDQ